MKFNAVAIHVLRKMYLHGYIGARHTSIDNLQKSFPKHERGNVNDAVKKLIKQDYIIPKPTGYGFHCSLNPQKIAQIRKNNQLNCVFCRAHNYNMVIKTRFRQRNPNLVL